MLCVIVVRHSLYINFQRVAVICRNTLNIVLTSLYQLMNVMKKKITLYFNKTKNKSNYVSPQIKAKLTKKLCEFIILDSRPFETVSDNSFISLSGVTRIFWYARSQH